jgi:hypothetical protein
MPGEKKDTPKFDPFLRPHINKGHQLEFFFVPSGGSKNPLTVKFMAFLTQLEDVYTSEWNPDKVYGRMDPIATFQGTVRTINLGWTVPAYSGKEAENNLRKMSKLISMCYPVYGGQNTSVRGAGQISGAPLIKLKFANLITAMGSNSETKKSSRVNGAARNGLLGWIDGISFRPNLEAGFYDPRPGQLFPKQIDLSCQFHALHEHPLGWSRSAGSKDGGDKSDSKAKPGPLRRRSKKAFPYGSKFGTGPAVAAEEIPSKPKQETVDEDTDKKPDVALNQETPEAMGNAAAAASVLEGVAGTFGVTSVLGVPIGEQKDK